MTRFIITALSLITVFSFGSCITSLHQLVTPDKVIMDNRVKGVWQQDDKTPVTVEEIVKSNLFQNSNKATVGKQEENLGFDNKEDSLLYSKSYLISFSKSGYNYYMIASLTRINNELYTDITPLSSVATSKPGNKTDDLFNNMPYMPSHTIARISFHNSTMEIKFLNGNFIKNQLEKGAMAVKYESDPLFNTALVTASPVELQQFIAKYGNDERLYSAENTITLTKI